MKYKVSSSTIQASKLLCQAIISSLGGSSAVGHTLKMSRQAVFNYEVKGYIPLDQVYSIAKILKLEVWHLSYFKLAEVLGEGVAHFPELVKELSFLSKEEKIKIMKVYQK